MPGTRRQPPSLVQLKLAGHFDSLLRPDRPASPSKSIDNARLKFRTPIQVQDACLPLRILSTKSAIIQKEASSSEQRIVNVVDNIVQGVLVDGVALDC